MLRSILFFFVSKKRPWVFVKAETHMVFVYLFLPRRNSQVDPTRK